MTKLLEIKEWLKGFYSRFDIYLQAIWKFILAAGAVSVLNQNVGFMEQLKNPIVVVVIGLVCSILPYGGISLVCAAVILAHFYELSLELTGITCLVFLFMYLFCLRFENKSSYALILTPLLFWLKIPYLAPLLVGLTGKMAGALSVGCGVVVYYILSYAKSMAPSLTSSTVDNLLETIRMIVDGLLSNQSMTVTVVAFVVTVLVVYFIRRLSVDYAWLIAIGVGTVVDLVILMAGDFTLSVEMPVIEMIVGSVVAILISLVIQFFLFSVDYSRTERVQFEDEEYVYYVKAVPKMKVTSPEVNVKRINAQKSHTETQNKPTEKPQKELSKESEGDLLRAGTDFGNDMLQRSRTNVTDVPSQRSRSVNVSTGNSSSQRTRTTTVSRNNVTNTTRRSVSQGNVSSMKTTQSSGSRTVSAQKSSQGNVTNIQDRIAQRTTHTTRDK